LKKKDLEKLEPKLKKLFDQPQFIRENERLAIVANKLNEKNKIAKELKKSRRYYFYMFK